MPQQKMSKTIFQTLLVIISLTFSEKNIKTFWFEAASKYVHYFLPSLTSNHTYKNFVGHMNEHSDASEANFASNQIVWEETKR